MNCAQKGVEFCSPQNIQSTHIFSKWAVRASCAPTGNQHATVQLQSRKSHHTSASSEPHTPAHLCGTFFLKPLQYIHLQHQRPLQEPNNKQCMCRALSIKLQRNVHTSSTSIDLYLPRKRGYLNWTRWVYELVSVVLVWVRNKQLHSQGISLRCLVTGCLAASDMELTEELNAFVNNGNSQNLGMSKVAAIFIFGPRTQTKARHIEYHLLLQPNHTTREFFKHTIFSVILWREKHDGIMADNTS